MRVFDFWLNSAVGMNSKKQEILDKVEKKSPQKQLAIWGFRKIFEKILEWKKKINVRDKIAYVPKIQEKKPS